MAEIAKGFDRDLLDSVVMSTYRLSQALDGSEKLLFWKTSISTPGRVRPPTARSWSKKDMTSAIGELIVARHEACIND